MERRGFITGGTWCYDRNITVDAWPEEDMAAVVLDEDGAGGGSSCNFAVDMRKLDPSVPVATQGLVGTDPEGDFLVGVAAEFGVDHGRMHRTDKARTEVTEAYRSAATGRRTHIIFYGTAALLTPDHFEFSGSNARYLHLGLPGIHAIMDAPWKEDANGWVTVLKKGLKAGLETNLELVSAGLGRIRELITPCLPYLTTLVVNDTEIGALAGVETVADGVTDPAACALAARKVLELGAMEVVVVHHTSEAVLVSRAGEEIHVPSVRVPDAERQGANGAGDAFCAGFFYGRHEGWSHEDCLRLGHATAAASLRAPGTYEAVGTAAENLALAERWGWR